MGAREVCAGRLDLSTWGFGAVGTGERNVGVRKKIGVGRLSSGVGYHTRALGVVAAVDRCRFTNNDWWRDLAARWLGAVATGDRSSLMCAWENGSRFCLATRRLGAVAAGDWSRLMGAGEVRRVRLRRRLSTRRLGAVAAGDGGSLVRAMERRLAVCWFVRLGLVSGRGFVLGF